MKKAMRLVCLMMTLIIVCLQMPAQAASIKKFEERIKNSVKYVAKNAVKLWEACDNSGWGRWEKLNGDKLRFRCKVYNHSDSMTLKSVKLYYYAEDRWGCEIYGDNYYYSVTSMTLRPGQKDYTEAVVIPERSRIHKLYCGIKQMTFSDGTTVEFKDHEIEFVNWTINK